MRSLATYTVIVYPDAATADADVNTTGAGSAFYGKVILKAGPDKEIGDGPFQTRDLPGIPSFSKNDWIFQPQPGGKFTLRPISGLSKVVSVPNAALATVVTFADARTEDAVPATSPIGLILLALALMGSGTWVMMRSRQKTEAA